MLADGATPALTRINRRTFACVELFEGLAKCALPWNDLQRFIVEKRVAAGASVFAQDEAHPFLYVVRAGLIKLVYERDDGEAWIKSFAQEGRFFASIAALKTGGRASFSAVALEETRLERIDAAPLLDLADRHLEWSRAVREALTLFAGRKEKRERELLTLGAEGRYRAALRDEPDLVARVPQKDLALYLGVTPVGLNRIARRVRGEA